MEGSAIAVIGMAGRLPGAGDLRAFWKNLSAGVESVHYFTDEELRAAGESEETIADPSYVKACARLDGIDLFDAAFFGMSPRDASIFDPQHRIFLECAWEAFEHAGYVGEAVGGPVGVFAACGMSEYMIKNVMTHPEVMTTVGEWLVRHTGNDTNFLATRVSYELNLRGPSMNVQTACSSSLVAIHLACQSLLNGECDVALAGGSTIYPEQNRGYYFKEGEIFSADGHTRSFDASSTGTTMCSATACVVLKRLADAQRDGDNVLAVIRGSAINNDGDDKVGYLAPSVSGQARVVTEALAIAGTSADEVSYVEAHGTGTRIGDPIEIAGLTQAFRESTTATQYCAIGSLKSNIGHAGEAAGVAGFVKTVLALENRQIPPSLNHDSPNEQCEFASSPFFVNTALRPWQAKTRVAGVHGLGAGGTNCHVIVEEAPARPPSGESRPHQLLVVSARLATALDAACANLARHLTDDPRASLADVAFTLAAGRTAFRHRRAVVARDAREAVAGLAGGDGRLVATQHHAGEAPGVAFLFPGGGAQYAGMARGLYETETVFRETVDQGLAFIQPRLGSDSALADVPGGGRGRASEREAGSAFARAARTLHRRARALKAVAFVGLEAGRPHRSQRRRVRGRVRRGSAVLRGRAVARGDARAALRAGGRGRDGEHTARRGRSAAAARRQPLGGGRQRAVDVRRGRPRRGGRGAGERAARARHRPPAAAHRRGRALRDARPDPRRVRGLLQDHPLREATHPLRVQLDRHVDHRRAGDGPALLGRAPSQHRSIRRGRAGAPR